MRLANLRHDGPKTSPALKYTSKSVFAALGENKLIRGEDFRSRLKPQPRDAQSGALIASLHSIIPADFADGRG